MSGDYTPPKANKADAAHAIVRSGLGTIPIAGAAATELFSAIVTPPLEKRKTEWMKKVGEALRNLESQKGINLQDLQNNDTFLDISLHATQAALRTSREEKLIALKNAILNSAMPSPINDSMQQMFINFIDTLTVWHLRLLSFLKDPVEWAEENNLNFSHISMGGTATIIEMAFVELRQKRNFYDQLGKDLYSRGLINGDNFHITMSGHGLLQKKTTDMGDRFLAYIENPLDGE